MLSRRFRRAVFLSAAAAGWLLPASLAGQGRPLQGRVEQDTTLLPPDEFAAGGECGPKAPYAAKGDCSKLKQYVRDGGRNRTCIQLRQEAIRLDKKIDALSSRPENTNGANSQEQGTVGQQLRQVQQKLEQDCPTGPVLQPEAPKLDTRGGPIKGGVKENEASGGATYDPPRKVGFKVGIYCFPNSDWWVGVSLPNQRDSAYTVNGARSDGPFNRVWGTLYRKPSGDYFVITRLAGIADLRRQSIRVNLKAGPVPDCRQSTRSSRP